MPRWTLAACADACPVSNGVKLNPFAAPSNGVNYNPFGAPKTIITPRPQQPFAGPSRLTNLFPNLHSISNDHVFGSSNTIPTDPAKYLAQFGYQRLR